MIKKVKRLTALMVSTILCLSSGSLQTVIAQETTDSTFAEDFKNPDGYAKLSIRWWYQPDVMTEEETRQELRNIADGGYGRVELIALSNVNSTFGEERWNEVHRWILDEASKLDITVDFTVGKTWPIRTPAINDGNDILAEQAIYPATADFTATPDNMVFQVSAGDFSLPEKLTEADDIPYELVAVTAAKKADGCGDNIYDIHSATDITSYAADVEAVSYLDETCFSDVSNASLTWEAPEEGDWTIFYFYRAGVNARTSFLDGAAVDPDIDHFSKKAMEKVTGYWEDYLFANGMKELYTANGGNIFADSLEIGCRDGGTLWTADMLKEFSNRRGYDLTPYLPAIFCLGYTDTPSYDFTEGGEQIRDDYYQTQTDLFTENHVGTLRQWANSNNMDLRYQAYGNAMEWTQPMLEADIIEQESLASEDTLDEYRMIDGVISMTSKETGFSVYSLETAAMFTLGWSQTWTGTHRQDRETDDGSEYWPSDGRNYLYLTDGSKYGMDDFGGNEDAGLLYHLHRAFAAGVNRAVLHGFSYKSTEQGIWPGDSEMNRFGYSNEWDDKTPLWENSRYMTDYISRLQYVLQQGQADLDLCMYDLTYWGTNTLFDWGINVLEDAGYTYDYITPELMNLENAVVSNQDGIPVLAADGPSYRALLINMKKSHDGSDDLIPNEIPVQTAEKLLDYAKAGLPIIIIGEIPNKTATFAGSPENMKNEEKRLSSIMEELESYENVSVVEDLTEAENILETSDILPDVRQDKEDGLLNFHRSTDKMELYYLYNSDLNNPMSGTVSLKGIGIPYILNAWTGDITPIAEYKTENDRTIVDLSLNPNCAILIALAEAPLTDADVSIHADHSTADEILFTEKDTLALRASSSGVYTTTLSNGQIVETEVAEVPSSLALTDWSMILESWSQADEENVLLTKIEEIGPFTFDSDNSLQPWCNIEGLENACGTGVYTTTFHLDEGWENGIGAYLTMEYAADTISLKVNEETVEDINQQDKHVDIGKYLHAGDNTIEIRVSSSLGNLKNPFEIKQEYGIMGEIFLNPYRQTDISLLV